MNDDSNHDGLVGHLIELRGSVVRSLAVLVVLMFALFPFAGNLYSWLAQPLLAELAGTSTGTELLAIGVLSPFIIQITTSFFVAFCIGLPYVLYEIWRFVAPGLYQHEKRLILPLIVSSTLLFFIGMAFAYFLVFKVVFSFVANMTPDGVIWTPDISEYFSFTLKIFFGFGLAFETPVVVYLLAKSGIVDVATMRNARPYVIVGAFIVAAVVTPPDVISQFMLAIPCWLLYEIGLWLAPAADAATAEEKTERGNEETA